jgi:hypothetical protein
MTHAEILDQANARGFKIHTQGGMFPATIHGSRLPFPRVSALNGAINVEVSWTLAERLATGQSVRVVA